jgi:copper transport protein
MRRVTVLALVAAGALALPAAAFAHSRLLHAMPNFRQRLSSPPRAVVLRFDQQVKALPDSIQVFSAGGRLLSRVTRNGRDARYVRADLPRLPRGAYTVRWHAISGDGHVVSGVYTFGVRVAAPPPTEAYGASGPTKTEGIVRWLYFVSLALLVGGLAFRLLVLPKNLPPAVERRFYRLTGLGAVAVVEVGIAAFILRAEDALQLPFGRLLYGDLSPIASGTRFGIAFCVMTLGFAWVAGLLFLAWLTERRAFLWAAFLLGVGLGSGLSLSGHSAADRGSSWLSELADWVHLSAAAVWVGGLVMLAACVFPLAPGLRKDAFLRFSRLATVLIALLLSAGIYLSILRLPRLSDLWEAGYGQVLLVKLSLVSLALCWGAFHHFVARPALERGRKDGFVALLPRSLVGESAVGMAILLVAALLVNAKPPPQPAPQPTQASVTTH